MFITDEMQAQIKLDIFRSILSCQRDHAPGSAALAANNVFEQLFVDPYKVRVTTTTPKRAKKRR